MSVSVLSDPQFHDEAAAFAFVEARLWPHGPICHHCKSGERVGALRGKTTRPGLYKCYSCRKPFTVRMGTVFESSHIEMHKWLQAIYLMCSSKKGISTNQLHRTLRITVKSAWFLSHRIREAMITMGMPPLGGEGGIVEVDETFYGRKPDVPVSPGTAHKHLVMSLVERRPAGALVRSFHIDSTSIHDTLPLIKANVSASTHLTTDEASQYRHIGTHFAGHTFTTHSLKEYVRGNTHTDTVEGFYSVFKRGMKGVYQHCAEHHLQRYVTELTFVTTTGTALGATMWTPPTMRCGASLASV